MELFERRRYYHCNHCGTFHFIETPEVEGVRVLRPHDAALPCPLCQATLMRALLDDRSVVDHCQQCRGLLMARATFGEAVWRRRARAAGLAAPPLPLDARELERRVTCPSCHARMDVHPYYGPGNVVIDSCSACDLIWLDHGELTQITDAPGRDRGSSVASSGAQPARPEELRLAPRLRPLSISDVWELLE
jgi:Zn-finger nucleic acid-binding protein